MLPEDKLFLRKYINKEFNVKYLKDFFDIDDSFDASLIKNVTIRGLECAVDSLLKKNPSEKGYLGRVICELPNSIRRGDPVKKQIKGLNFSLDKNLVNEYSRDVSSHYFTDVLNEYYSRVN